MANDNLVFDYEVAAIRGVLTDVERTAVLDAFTRTSDVHAIATDTNLPVDMVRECLEDPAVVLNALKAKTSTVGMLFVGKVLDRLILTASGEGNGRASDEIAASKLLIELLDLQPKSAAKKTAGKVVDKKKSAYEEAVHGS